MQNNLQVVWKSSAKGKGASWNLESDDDAFVNGAFFAEEGKGRNVPHYGPQQKFTVRSKEEVRSLTRDAGVLQCHKTC